MSYVKQNFEDGNPLYADQLNHIEEGIKEIENAVNQMSNPDLSGYAKKTDIPTSLPASDVYDWAKQPNKPTYTANEVGAEAKGTATTAVTNHNVDEQSHNDIRLLIKALAEKLNALANSDDTTLDQMAEVVAYIKNNKSLIDAITTSKVNVTDIIDNLTTNVSNKPLSAKQGVALKALIEAIIVPTKVSAFENDVKYLTSVPSEYVTETKLTAKGYQTAQQVKDYAQQKFDATVYELPVLYLTGDVSPIAVSKDNKVTLDYVYGERSGTCTLKGQGATSYKNAQALVNAGKAGKFNYTINFDTAFEAVEGWGSQKKYCLKANFIDHSHSRNVVSAKIWGKIVKSRTPANATLNALPNGGAVDGFPVVIILNNEFHGLYTFNIPKDGWMFGLVEDNTKTQAVVGANQHTEATQFKGLLVGDESDFELEFVSDEDNADWVTSSLNRCIQSCIDSWGGDLDTTVAQYLDLESAIDYYILVVVLRGSDMVDKNYLLTTLDGTKWFFTAYDIDSTYGLEWDGSKLNRPVTNINFEFCADRHRVFELIKRFKTNALKARYAELRQDILSESRICQMFENFAWAIPSPVALEDVKKYPTILGSSVNGIDQIARWVRMRLEQCDKWIDALPAQETPVEPEKPVEMVNQVPISTDTDGSIYNDVGYKDNVRLSSNGGVSGTAQTGSVTTGFIPCTNVDVLRIKGAVWLREQIATGHFYVNFYKPDKSLKYAMAASSYAEGSWGNGVTYDATTGITTFDFKNTTLYTAGNANGATLIRLNAYGKGADLIVTVNQEITE